MQYDINETLAVAKAQKGVLWCVLANIVCIFAYFFIPFIFLLVLPFQIYFIYKLASALKAQAPALWVVGMFIPLLSLILLLILSQRATNVIQTAGFKVGLMGANISDIEAKIQKPL